MKDRHGEGGRAGGRDPAGARMASRKEQGMITIVGELINTSRAEVNEAVDNRDEAKIRELARNQADAGATYIDVNCGSRVHDELEVMEWLVNIVQDEVSTPICFDSPNHLALAKGLEVYKGTDSMINSISGEEGRYETIFPLVKQYGSKIVLLCMDSTGMPETCGDRMKVVDDLYARLKEDGVDDDQMYFDALVKPVSSITQAGAEVLATNRAIKEKYPETHQILGLSNISFGLPKRARLNRVFTVQTMTEGVDGYILDPTNKEHMADIITAETLLGRDPYCKQYLKANRKGKFDF